MALTRLELSLEGKWLPARGSVRRWTGLVRSRSPFASLLLVATPRRIFWSKAEIARSEMPLTVDVHVNGSGAGRVIFLGGSGWIQDYVAEALPDVVPTEPGPPRFSAGSVHTLFAFEARPPARLQILALAASDVTEGATGVWSPEADALAYLPTILSTIFAAGRSGSVPISRCSDPEVAQGV
jgi:hypothetical protein